MLSPSRVEAPDISRRRFLQSTGIGVVAALAAGDAAAAQPNAELPQYPQIPHVVTAHGAPYFRDGGSLGWSASTYEERLRAIRGLHPDLLDYHRLLWVRGNDVPLPGGVENQLEFSLEEGLPGTAGQTPYIQIDESDFPDRYEYLRREGNWRFPDGSPVETRRHMFAERLSGEPHGYSVQAEGIGIASVFCPAILDILTFEAAGVLDAGFVGMFYDSVTTPRVQGLDASRWAQAAFREHLRSLPAPRLDELGVDDPAGFDIGEALSADGVTPGAERHPARSPIYQEYTLFHHRGVKGLVQAYHDWVAEAYPQRAEERRAHLYANHFVGDSLHGSVAASIYTTDPVDVIHVEDDRTKPPEHVRAFAYKLFDAASRGEKPVLFEGEMHDAPGEGDKLRGLDAGRTYTTLMRLQIAEAYAQGVPRKLSLTSWGNIPEDRVAVHWIRPDGTVPQTLQSFADFLFVNRRFLAETEADANVAVVYSMPTNVWGSAPQWDRYDRVQGDSFRGACRALTDAHLAYDVRIFGHERLWNDEDQLDGLSDYDAVVLAGHSAIGDRHATALGRVLDSGGTVVVSGDPPGRDEYHEERERAIFDRDGVVVLDENPARHRITDGESAADLVDAVRSAATVRVTPGASLGVSRLRQRDPDRLIVHLVNYDWDMDSDSMNGVSNVSVEVSDIPFEFGVARYVSPQESTSLDVAAGEGGVSVTVPAVAEWGFVVFAPTSADIDPDAAEEEAASAARDVRESLAEARDRLESPESWRPFLRAEVFVREVDLAVEAGAYDLALSRAESAEASLQRLVEEASVGTSTSGPNGPSTPPDSASTTSTVSVDSPGFTVLSGIVGAVLAILLKWGRGSGETEE